MSSADLPDLERKRLRALLAADIKTAAPMHAEDYQLVTPNGSEMTKDDYLGAIASGQLRYRVFEPVSDIVVLGDGPVAVVRTMPGSASTTGPACAAGARTVTGCATSSGRWSGRRRRRSSMQITEALVRKRIIVLFARPWDSHSGVDRRDDP